MTTVDLSDPTPRPAPRRWWRPLALWTAAVVLYSSVLAVQVGLGWSIALRSGAIYFYTLAVLMIPVGRLSKRWIPGEMTPVALVLRHLLLGVVTIAVWLGLNVLHDWLSIGPMFWTFIYEKNWGFQLLFAVTVYCTALGVMLTSQAWRRERERVQREGELLIVARDAELSAIRTQFQPHFVLNALNSLLALIDTDPALARTMVVRLADLMKSVFDRLDLPAVPLERELDLIRAYLDVERIRFGDRLTVAFEIEDAARGVLVPPFLLQPLVENAVKHGVAPHARAGEVRVTARIIDGKLQLVVRDSGTGTSATLGTGRGLTLTRRRLDTVYGGGYMMTMDRRPDGTAVKIVLPAEIADVA